MARYTGPSCRQCRRIGEKLFLKGTRCYSEKCAVERKKSIPGAAAGKRRGKSSDYGMQLNEKQKVRKMYGMLETQFRKYYADAARMDGITGHALLRFLEKRLDNVVYKSGLALSLPQSRQFVMHGHVLVNGKRVDIPSYQVKIGDTVEIRDSFRQNDKIKAAMELNKNSIPEWIGRESGSYTARIVREPQRADIGANINENTIVEFYSK